MTKKLTLILMRVLALYSLFYALSFVNYIFHLNVLNTKFIFQENRTVELIISIFFILIQFVQSYAFWKIKKWSLFLYIFTVVAFHLFFIMSGKWTSTMLIAPVIIIPLVLINYKNLD